MQGDETAELAKNVDRLEFESVELSKHLGRVREETASLRGRVANLQQLERRVGQMETENASLREQLQRFQKATTVAEPTLPGGMENAVQQEPFNARQFPHNGGQRTQNEILDFLQHITADEQPDETVSVVEQSTGMDDIWKFIEDFNQMKKDDLGSSADLGQLEHHLFQAVQTLRRRAEVLQLDVPEQFRQEAGVRKEESSLRDFQSTLIHSTSSAIRREGLLTGNNQGITYFDPARDFMPPWPKPMTMKTIQVASLRHLDCWRQPAAAFLELLAQENMRCLRHLSIGSIDGLSSEHCMNLGWAIAQSSLLETLVLASLVIPPEGMLYLSAGLLQCRLKAIVVRDVGSNLHPLAAALAVGRTRHGSLDSIETTGGFSIPDLAAVIVHCGSHLRRLYLRSIEITGVGMQSLASGLACCGALEDLTLSQTQMDPNDAELLAVALMQCSGLRSFDCSANAVSDKGAKAIAAALAFSYQLEHIDMGQNRIGNDGMRAIGFAMAVLCQADRPRRPRHLCLQSNRIGDKGLVSLVRATLHAGGCVEVLDMSRNRITTSGALVLTEGLRHALFSIKSVILYGNPIKDFKLGNTNLTFQEAATFSGVLKI